MFQYCTLKDRKENIISVGSEGASQGALVVKNPPANAGDVKRYSSIPGSGRCAGGGQGNPWQYSCLANSHGQRSLEGYSPGGCKESDMTETTQHAHRKLNTH